MIKSYVDFKTERLEREFHLVHPLLRAAYYDMGYEVKKAGSVLVITCLIRSREENAAISKRELSSHLFARGGDSRVWNLPKGVFVGELIAGIKDTYGNKIHIIRHSGGTADHIHMNVNWQFADQFTEVYYDSN